eukprot:gene8364-189_t
MSFLSSSYFTADERPSFFEIVAQDRMIPGLKFACRYVLEVFSQRFENVRVFLDYNEEIFSFLQLIVENHYLKYFEKDASFCEHLYGLKRVKLLENGKSRSLTSYEKNVSLLFTVFIPYLKNKFDEIYIENNLNPSRINSTLKLNFQKIWPYFNAIYEAPFFGYILMYLFNKTDFISPFMHFQKQILQRITLPDLMKQTQNLLKSRFELLKSMNERGGFYYILGLVIKIGHTVSDYSRHLLFGLVFIYKFLEWWYSTEAERNQNQNSSKPILPPPPPPKKSKDGIDLPKDCSLCPLCYKKRINPTQLSISGYVFCYKCINDYVNEFQKCPVSLLPANENFLRRIYDE